MLVSAESPTEKRASGRAGGGEDGHDAIPEGVSPAFLEALASQRHIGMLVEPDGIAEMTGSCGDSMLVQLHIQDGVILAVRSMVRGCAYSWACATALGDLATGLAVEDALWLEPEALANALGGLPDDHVHCARLALNALGEALAMWQARETGMPGMPGAAGAAA